MCARTSHPNVAGQSLQIGSAARGATAYLCVRGGFQGPRILDSCTALTPIKKDDRLRRHEAGHTARSLDSCEIDGLFETNASEFGLFHLIDGPQVHWFDTASFYAQEFVVSASSNRMGLRLEGKEVIRQPKEMVSEAVAPGAVQITNNGLPIVLGVDGQTIGGYPKIGQIIRADLDRLAQMRPGGRVRFARVSIEDAEARANQRERTLRRWMAALRL